MARGGGFDEPSWRWTDVDFILIRMVMITSILLLFDPSSQRGVAGDSGKHIIIHT